MMQRPRRTRCTQQVALSLRSPLASTIIRSTQAGIGIAQ